MHPTGTQGFVGPDEKPSSTLLGLLRLNSNFISII
jgi:hypothetical protein